MRKNRLLYLVALLIAVGMHSAIAQADDVVVTGTVGGTQTISSNEGIIIRCATIANGANVTADSTYEVHLQPGTRIADGARLTVRLKDMDGLSNRCEMTHFHHLNFGPNEDPDNDDLSNFEECALGTDPTDTDRDNDDDGLEDWWEIQYFGIDLSNGRNDDTDGDGISNYIEYRLKSNPSVSNGAEPGLHYEYDKLGRIKRIQRIPEK